MELKIRSSARYHNVFLTRWSFARVKKEIGLLVIISSKIYIFALIWQMFPQGKQFQQNVKEMIELTMNTTSFFYEFIQKMPEI